MLDKSPIAIATVVWEICQCMLLVALLHPASSFAMPESSTQAEQFLAAEMKSESVAGGNFKCFKQLQSKNDSRYDALICYSTLAFHN